MSSKINLQTCEYACKSSIFQDNQLIWYNKGIKNRRGKPCQTVPKISSCVRELKDMITDLKQMIKMLQATVDAANRREEAFIQERDNLKDEIALLRKKLFGSSSEKSPVDFPG